MDVISQLLRLTVNVSGLAEPASITYESSLVVIPKAADATRAQRCSKRMPIELDSILIDEVCYNICITEGNKAMAACFYLSSEVLFLVSGQFSSKLLSAQRAAEPS